MNHASVDHVGPAPVRPKKVKKPLPRARLPE
jgi:hypothetical protein